MNDNNINKKKYFWRKDIKWKKYYSHNN
jgi:hypothetical protein